MMMMIYCSALPCCTSNVTVHSLYWMRLKTGSQCSCFRSGDASARGGALQSSLAAASFYSLQAFYCRLGAAGKQTVTIIFSPSVTARAHGLACTVYHDAETQLADPRQVKEASLRTLTSVDVHR